MTELNESLADIAYRKLEHKIVTLALAPGDQVSEKSLCDMLDMGRTPVREALIHLEREGLVQIQARRGACIAPIDVKYHLELLEMRKPLQILAAKLGTQRASQAEREQLLLLAKELKSSAQHAKMEHYIELNKRVHNIEISVTHNRAIQKTFSLLHGLSRRFWFAFVSNKDDLLKGANFHAEVLCAMANEDINKAEQSALLLIEFLEGLVRKEFERYINS